MSAWGVHIKFGGLALFGIGLTSLVFLGPAWRTQASVARELEDNRAHLKVLESEVAMRAVAEERLADLHAHQREWMKPIPRRADPHGLMQAIIVGAERLPLGERNLSRGTRPTQTDTQALGFKIETSGQFEHVYALLAHVESLPRLIVIRELMISNARSIGSGEVKATIALDAFYESDDEAADTSSADFTSG